MFVIESRVTSALTLTMNGNKRHIHHQYAEKIDKVFSQIEVGKSRYEVGTITSQVQALSGASGQPAVSVYQIPKGAQVNLGIK